MHINISFLDLFRVRVLRENTLLNVSYLLFLNHFRVCDFVHFYFEIFVISNNPSTRGPHSTFELSLKHSLFRIHFVSLSLTLFSSLSLLWMECT